jgi:hypothetical protein
MLTFPFNVFPGAGGNWQSFDTRWASPNISVNFAGNPSIEREVTEDVASYGRQIGWLNDIVTALVEGDGAGAVKSSPAAEDAWTKLRAAQARIDDIKKRRQDSAVDQAKGALASLASTDKSAYARLVRSLDPERPPDG